MLIDENGKLTLDYLPWFEHPFTRALLLAADRGVTLNFEKWVAGRETPGNAGEAKIYSLLVKMLSDPKVFENEILVLLNGKDR
jgi:hypothetical protein